MRETGYDALGQRTYVTEAGIGSPAVQRTSYLSYDPFGRPATVRPPDGAAHDVTFSYFGDQVTSRSAKIGTSRNATTGAIVESSVTTREIYDRQGRLWRVWENDNGGGVRTEYGYDVGQRLATVSQVRTVGTSTVTQTRRFNYDGRGFLTSEQHPEKGVSGNGSVSYFNYDARGHAGRVIDGPHDLTFSYDRAERLTQTRETGGSQRVLSSFTYATSNAFGSSNGKPAVVIAVNDEARAWGVSANALVKVAAAALGGSGGGKDDVAQGGGADVTNVDQALVDVEHEVGRAATSR